MTFHLLIYPKRPNERIQNRHRGCEENCNVIETNHVLIFFLFHVEVSQHEETDSDGDLKRDGDPYQDQYWVEEVITIGAFIKHGLELGSIGNQQADVQQTGS